MFRILKLSLLFILISNQLISQSNALISSGNEKLQRKIFSEALKDFNQVLLENPDNIQAICGSALAQNGLGKTQEALALAENSPK
ncbi:MAG: hypothetical protein HC905_06715 [Bacteroidales bacterium]|nr:hypothetical protein [Bacteroidales bacterium]